MRRQTVQLQTYSNFKSQGKKKKQLHNTHSLGSTMATVESTTNVNKRILKMMEWAKAALEEQHDGPKKHKNGGEGGNMLKKGHTGPKIDRDTSTTRETLSSSPAPNQSMRATVEDVPDDDGFISQGSIDNDESYTTQGEKSNSKSRAEDVPGMLEYCAHSGNSQ